MKTKLPDSSRIIIKKQIVLHRRDAPQFTSKLWPNRMNCWIWQSWHSNCKPLTYFTAPESKKMVFTLFHSKECLPQHAFFTRHPKTRYFVEERKIQNGLLYITNIIKEKQRPPWLQLTWEIFYQTNRCYQNINICFPKASPNILTPKRRPLFFPYVQL